MGFLDNVVKGLGQDAAGGLGDLLKGQGGVGGLAEKFGQAGLGDVIGSWVGNGANAGITPEQITAVIGHGPIADIAAKMGVPTRAANPYAKGSRGSLRPHRTPWYLLQKPGPLGSYPYRISAIGNVPALVPGPLARL